jgi:hypothetical protein
MSLGLTFGWDRKGKDGVFGRRVPGCAVTTAIVMIVAAGRERDPGNRDYSGVGPEDECANSSPKIQMNSRIHLFGKLIIGALSGLVS